MGTPTHERWSEAHQKAVLAGHGPLIPQDSRQIEKLQDNVQKAMDLLVPTEIIDQTQPDAITATMANMRLDCTTPEAIQSSAAAGWGAPVPKSSMQPGTPVATVLGVNSKPWEGTKWTEEEWKKWQQSKQERSKHIDSPTDADLEAAAKAVEAGLQNQQPVSPFSKAPPNSQGAGAAKIQAQGYEVTRQRQSPPRGAPYPTSGPQ